MVLPSGNQTYPLVNVYSSRTGKSPSLSSVNQLFLCAMASSSQSAQFPEGSIFSLDPWLV